MRELVAVQVSLLVTIGVLVVSCVAFVGLAYMWVRFNDPRTRKRRAVVIEDMTYLDQEELLRGSLVEIVDEFQTTDGKTRYRVYCNGNIWHQVPSECLEVSDVE